MKFPVNERITGKNHGEVEGNILQIWFEITSR